MTALPKMDFLSEILKISIITINRNNIQGLEKTIQSVIKQTYANIEYIVIDGASDDGSVELIKKYALSIHTWVSEADGGIYNAMNKGLKKATGNYVLFLNSGDYLVDNTIIERVAKSAKNEDIIYGDMAIYEEHSLRVLKSPDTISYHSRYQHDLPPQPVSFIKLELFDSVGGFNEHYKIIADVVLISLLLSSPDINYKHLNLAVTIFDTHGISSNYKNQQAIYEERKRFILEKFPHYLNAFQATYSKNFLGKVSSGLKSLFLRGSH
jgi:glycosyltransferase involved in cell wall biosynthesis